MTLCTFDFLIVLPVETCSNIPNNTNSAMSSNDVAWFYADLKETRFFSKFREACGVARFCLKDAFQELGNILISSQMRSEAAICIRPFILSIHV